MPVPPNRRPSRTLTSSMFPTLRALACLVLCAAAAAAQGAAPQPLDDLGAGLYQGEQGGLYPRGLNMLTGAYRIEGLTRAQRVVPLDALGHHAPEWGRIGVVLLGSTDTSVVAEQLRQLAAADPERSAAVVTANGAVAASIRSLASGRDRTWTLLPQLLRAAGLAPAQVQVAWLDATSALVDQPFPENARLLQEDLAAIVARARQELPSLRLVFVSSGAYGGYAGARAGRDAYEAAFAVKGLIEERLAASSGGASPAPWIAWGPYLWAAGAQPRSDGLTWQPSHFLVNGRQLSTAGAGQSARKLLEFLHLSAQARSWYLEDPGPGCLQPAMVSAFGASRVGEGAPALAASALPTVPSPEPLHIVVRDAPARAPGLFLVTVDPRGEAVLPDGPLILAPNRAQALPVLTDGGGRAAIELGRLRVPREKFCGLTVCVQFAAIDDDGMLVASPALRLQTGH